MTGFSQQLVELLPRLRRFSLALTRSAPDADDLVQGVVERALAHREMFKPGTRLDSWLFRIAQNLWRDELRAHRRRAEPIEDEGLVGEDGRESFHRQLEVRDMAQQFDGLPEEQRLVLTLVVLDGMRYHEAAETLGVPVGTVMSRLARARGRLATAMGNEVRRLRAAR